MQTSGNCPQCGTYTRNFYGVKFNAELIHVCHSCALKINPPIRSANSTCRDLGHQWISTTALNFRMCDRLKCNTAQRFVGESWVDVEPRKKSPKVETRMQDGDGNRIDIGRKVQQGAYVDTKKADTDIKSYWM